MAKKARIYPPIVVDNGLKVGKKIAPQGTGRKPPVEEDEPGWKWGSMGNKKGPHGTVLRKDGGKGRRK